MRLQRRDNQRTNVVTLSLSAPDLSIGAPVLRSAVAANESSCVRACGIHTPITSF